MQPQTKNEMFVVLDKYHQILLKENMKAAPDKLHFFLTCVKFLAHINERNTKTPLKSRIDAIIKPRPPSNKTKTQDFLGMLNYLSKNFYQMQLYLRPFYKILRQQNKFEWTKRRQKLFEETKIFLTEHCQTLSQIQKNKFMLCATS